MTARPDLAAQCVHERILTWRDEETNDPVRLWSCAACSVKFVPLSELEALRAREAQPNKITLTMDEARELLVAMDLALGAAGEMADEQQDQRMHEAAQTINSRPPAVSDSEIEAIAVGFLKSVPDSNDEPGELEFDHRGFARAVLAAASAPKTEGDGNG